MDETAVWLDAISNRTIDLKGAKPSLWPLQDMKSKTLQSHYVHLLMEQKESLLLFKKGKLAEEAFEKVKEIWNAEPKSSKNFKICSI